MPETLISLIGGRLAIDFVNAGSRARPLSWEELVVFLEATHVISKERSTLLLELPETDPQAAHGLLQRAARFRASVRDILEAMLRRKEPRPDAIESINDLLQVTEGHDELRHDGESWRMEFVARESGLEWLLAAIARSAAEIVAEGITSSHVRVCANPGCGLFFYDASRTSRRRWCAMAVCGNRHKVASFARKHAGERRAG
jgi:predicted RNA-binding Zn ribbon-like protein